MKLSELIVEAYGCEGALDDGPALCEALRLGAQDVGATVVREAAHAYAPHGVTAMIFLAESHLLVTTWPELGYAVAEVFLCNDTMDVKVPWRRLEMLLRPADVRFHEVPLAIGRRPG